VSAFEQSGADGLQGVCHVPAQLAHGTVPFEIRHALGSSPAVLVVAGEIDPATTPELARVVVRTAVHDRVVLDLSHVTFFCAAGVNALVQLRNRLGDRVERGPTSEVVQRVLDMCDMSNLLRRPEG
jgi:anti-anti-sigma factor